MFLDPRFGHVDPTFRLCMAAATLAMLIFQADINARLFGASMDTSLQMHGPVCVWIYVALRFGDLRNGKQNTFGKSDPGLKTDEWRLDVMPAWCNGMTHNLRPKDPGINADFCAEWITQGLSVSHVRTHASML